MCMSRESTERQAELLQAVTQLSAHYKASKAQTDHLSNLYQSAVRAAVVEGVTGQQIADNTGLSNARVSIIAGQTKKIVRQWFTPDRDGLSPRDEWLAWLEKHPEPPA